MTWIKQEKIKREKTKQKNNEQLSPEMVIKCVRSVRKGEGSRLRREGFMEKVSFKSGMEERWSDGDDDDDDELMRERWDDNDRD